MHDKQTEPSGAKIERIIIEPGRQGVLQTIRDVWRHRELFYFLTWRDVSVKYKQTVLGVLWVVLQPVLATMIFTLVFYYVAKLRAPVGMPYPLFALVGIICWNYFSGSLGRSGESLVNGRQLLTKVYFPRIVIPVSAAMAGLVDLALSFSVVAVLMAYYRIVPGVELAALPALILLTMFLTIGLGTLSAAANARYRDVRFIVEYSTRILIFLTPVFYSYSMIPERWRPIYMLNPMVGIVEGFRWSILQGPFPGRELLVATVISVAASAMGLEYFRRVERTFADVV